MLKYFPLNFIRICFTEKHECNSNGLGFYFAKIHDEQTKVVYWGFGQSIDFPLILILRIDDEHGCVHRSRESIKKIIQHFKHLTTLNIFPRNSSNI